MLAENLISDLTPFATSPQTELVFVNLEGNPIDCVAQQANLALIDAKGVAVLSDCP